MIKGILSHMRQILRTYRAVKVVQDICNDIDRASFIKQIDDGYIAAVALTSAAKRDFKQKYPKFKPFEIDHIFADAIKNEYLQGSSQHHNGGVVGVVSVDSKGRKLLDTPIGFLQELLSEYGQVVSFLTGSFVVGILFFLYNLGDYLIRILFKQMG